MVEQSRRHDRRRGAPAARSRHSARHRARSGPRPARRLTGRGLLTLALTAVLLAVIAVAALRHFPAPARPATADVLVPRTGYYLGVSEAHETISYRPVDQFAAAIGRQPNIVLFYAALGDRFQSRLAAQAHAHHAVPFVQISPGNATMAAVAAGRHDSELRSYADQVRGYRHPVIVGFAAEMNGGWYPWGWQHTRPATWVAAWRHVVTVFRDQGALNATWLWTVSVSITGTGPIHRWWPGHRYVNWVGIDGYYYYRASTFDTVFGSTINQIRAITGKPVLLSETAIGPVAGQAAKISDLFAGVRAAQVVGFVWFDQTQHHGIYHQDWRLEGHPAAIDAFRRAVRAYR